MHANFFERKDVAELGLDFGKKAYGNLVELARLQEHVAGELGVATGALVVHAKSAHVYEPEWSRDGVDRRRGRPGRTSRARHRRQPASNRTGPAATLR